MLLELTHAAMQFLDEPQQVMALRQQVVAGGVGEREPLAQVGDLGGRILGWRGHGSDYTVAPRAGAP